MCKRLDGIEVGITAGVVCEEGFFFDSTVYYY